MYVLKKNSVIFDELLKLVKLFYKQINKSMFNFWERPLVNLFYFMIP